MIKDWPIETNFKCWSLEMQLVQGVMQEKKGKMGKLSGQSGYSASLSSDVSLFLLLCCFIHQCNVNMQKNKFGYTVLCH